MQRRQDAARAAVDLEAHDVALPAAPQLLLEGLDIRLPAFVVQLQLGVAREAERRGFEDHLPGEQRVEPGADHVVEHDEGDAFAAGDAHEAGQARGHLDDRDAIREPFLGRREAEGQVDAQRREHRERPGRVDGQRREHRQHVVAEVGGERLAADRVEIGRGGDANPVGGEGRQQVRRHQAVQPVDHGVHAGRHLAELLRRREAGRVGIGVAFLDRVPQPGDAHHEELVEVRRHDRRELGALEQRVRRVGRLFGHPLVEGEPGELAVEEQLGRALALALRTAIPRRPCGGGSRLDPRSAPREGPPEDVVEEVGAGLHFQALHRQVADALDLEQPRRRRRPSRAGPAPSGCARRRGRWRCAGARPSCSRARARCGRAPCRAGATAAAGRAGGSGPRWR